MGIETRNNNNNGIQLEINLEEGYKAELVKVATDNKIHENLLNKVKGEWLACGMPINKFLDERENKILGIKFSGHQIEPKYLSKINGNWYVLYNDKQLTIPEWEKKIDQEKLNQTIREEERADDRKTNSGGWG